MVLPLKDVTGHFYPSQKSSAFIIRILSLFALETTIIFHDSLGRLRGSSVSYGTFYLLVFFNICILFLIFLFLLLT